MSQIKKLLKKFKRKPTPTDILFSEAHRVLEAFGYQQRRPSGGSHFIYTHPEIPGYEVSIVFHDKKVKVGYIRNVI